MSLLRQLIFISAVKSILDIFGLILILPIINILINPAIVQQNRILHSAFESGGFHSVESFVISLMCLILFLFILKTVFSFLIIRWQSASTCTLLEELSLGRWLGYMNEEYDFHLNQNSAFLVRNVASIPFDFLMKILMPFIQIISEIFIVLIVFVCITWYDPLQFIAILAIMMPFAFFYFRFMKVRLKKFSDERDIHAKDLYINTLQSMTGVREITLFKKFNFFKKKFADSIKGISDTLRVLNTVNEFASKMIEFIAFMGIFMIFLVSYLLHHNTTQLLEFLVVFALSMTRLLPSFNRIILHLNNMKSSEYVFEHMQNIPSEISFKNPVLWMKEKTEPLLFHKSLSFRNLSFTYPATDRLILDNINLEIPVGTTTGIVGPSGSGKTTLLNILLRLYDEKEGGIYVDEEKISRENQSAWFDLISFVPQNIFILDASFADNIAFGSETENQNRELLEQVIDQAGLRELINQSPQGIHTNIGESGLKISGGQRQRIGIARALYSQARILIFDEATSALDAATEEMITESIRSLAHLNLTIIIVAHRIQTLKYCDSIYRITNGKLSAAMSYETVLNEK